MFGALAGATASEAPRRGDLRPRSVFGGLREARNCQSFPSAGDQTRRKDLGAGGRWAGQRPPTEPPLIHL